jgi:hypothetical protein
MATQTSVNNEFKNNVTVSESTAGTSAALLISNTDNSNTSSHAKVVLSTGGASAGDAFIHLDNGVVDLTIGIDNSDSDSLVISANATPGTSNRARCTPDGEWTYPLQSGFFAYVDNTQSNVTGSAGTVYTPTIDLEDFDQNSDYSTATSIFTAPKDGVYFLIGCINLMDESVATMLITDLITSAGNFSFINNRPASSRAGMSNGGVFIELDASDTAYLQCRGFGEASNRLDVGADSSFFCGVKVS